MAATFGIRPPYEPDETFPAGDVFPTGKKTPFYGAVIVQEGADRRIERIEWGVPTQVPSKRDPMTKLTRYVTNVRNLSSSFWRSMLTTPARRCLVPVTAFSKYGVAPGQDGTKPLHWFDVPSRPIFAFAGIWRPTDSVHQLPEPAPSWLPCSPSSSLAPSRPGEHSSGMIGTEASV